MMPAWSDENRPEAATRWLHGRRYRLGRLSMTVLSVAALGFCLWIAAWRPGWQADSALVGRPAPPAPGARWLDGRPFAIDALRGRVVLLTFWSMYALPCLDHMPVIEQLHGRYAADPRVQIIAWNVDVRPGGKTSPEQVAAFGHGQGWTVGQVIDPSGLCFRTYAVEGVPRDILIGPDGVVAAVHVGHGPDTLHVLRERIDALRAGRSLPSEPPAR